MSSSPIKAEQDPPHVLNSQPGSAAEQPAGEQQPPAGKSKEKTALVSFWAQLSEFGEEADCKKYWTKQTDLRTRYLDDVIEIERRLQILAEVAKRKDESAQGKKPSEDKKRKRSENSTGKLQSLAGQLARVQVVLTSEPIGDIATIEDQTAKIRTFISSMVIPIGRKLVKTGLPSDAKSCVLGAQDDLGALKGKYLEDINALLSHIGKLSEVAHRKEREKKTKSDDSTQESVEPQPAAAIVTDLEGGATDQDKSGKAGSLDAIVVHNPKPPAGQPKNNDRIQWLIKNANRVVEVLMETEETNPPRTLEVLLQVQNFAHEVLVPIGQKLVKGQLPSEKAAERRSGKQPVTQHVGVPPPFPQAVVSHFQMPHGGFVPPVGMPGVVVPSVGMPQMIGVGMPQMNIMQVGGMVGMGGVPQMNVPGIPQVGNVPPMGNVMPQQTMPMNIMSQQPSGHYGVEEEGHYEVKVKKHCEDKVEEHYEVKQEAATSPQSQPSNEQNAVPLPPSSSQGGAEEESSPLLSRVYSAQQLAPQSPPMGSGFFRSLSSNSLTDGIIEDFPQGGAQTDWSAFLDETDYGDLHDNLF